MSRIGLWGVEKRRGPTLVLDGVNLAVAAGEAVVLTGARGAGVSTLLAVAAVALPPDAGELEIEGRRTGGLQVGSLPYVRRNIGYLPADPPLLPDETALENVMLALAARGHSPAQAQELAQAALQALGIDSLAERSAARLSLPERRLVGLARALVGTPPIIVLDDPTAALDERDRDRLLQGLAAAQAAGSAILCGSGDATLVAAMNQRGARPLRLEGGRIAGATALRLVDAEAGITQPLDHSAAGPGRSAAGGGA